jgi:hypothetical protein
MNKELFMLIVFIVKEYDNYWMCKNTPPDCVASHRCRNAQLP